MRLDEKPVSHELGTGYSEDLGKARDVWVFSKAPSFWNVYREFRQWARIERRNLKRQGRKVRQGRP
jgi:hypothetical protein